MERKALIDLSVMYATGTLPEQFQNASTSPEKVIRAGINEILGLPEDATTIDKKALRRNAVELFEFLEEVLDKKIYEGDLGILEQWVEIRNEKLGDQTKFLVPDNQLFRVASISDGNGNVRRQRLREGQEYMIPTEILAVKIYEEFPRYHSGRIDFYAMIDRVAKSVQRDITQRIHEVLLKTFRVTGVTTPYAATISGATADAKVTHVLEMAKHIEAKTGLKPIVAGSALALHALNPKYMSDAQKGEANQLGYANIVTGLKAMEIPPLHKEGTDTFVLGADELFLIPELDEKMFKVVFEGDSYIEDRASNRADLQVEYLFLHKVGVGVIAPSTFGYLKFT